MIEFVYWTPRPPIGSAVIVKSDNLEDVLTWLQQNFPQVNDFALADGVITWSDPMPLSSITGSAKPGDYIVVSTNYMPSVMDHNPATDTNAQALTDAGAVKYSLEADTPGA